MKHPEETKARALDLYRSGEKFRSISSTLGISDTTLCRWLHAERLGRRTNGQPRMLPFGHRPSYQRPEIVAAAVERFRNGDKVTHIAAELRCNPTSVSQWAHQHGLRRTSNGRPVSA